MEKTSPPSMAFGEKKQITPCGPLRWLLCVGQALQPDMVRKGDVRA